jgi:hypothetical protein
MRLSYFGGAITAFPIIETINADISEYIATNVISITDGQLYTSRKLFIESSRPAIDSALSVSRIGSNAQCKMMRYASSGLKNALTNMRLDLAQDQTSHDTSALKALSSSLYQAHYLISTIDFTIALLSIYKDGIRLLTDKHIHLTAYMLAEVYFYTAYIMFLIKSSINDSSRALYRYMLSSMMSHALYMISSPYCYVVDAEDVTDDHHTYMLFSSLFFIFVALMLNITYMLHSSVSFIVLIYLTMHYMSIIVIIASPFVMLYLCQHLFVASSTDMFPSCMLTAYIIDMLHSILLYVSFSILSYIFMFSYLLYI